MKMRHYLIISLIICVIAGLFVAINNELLIVRLPQLRDPYESLDAAHAVVNKKVVRRVYWHHDAWHNESTELLWPENAQQKLYYLINSWLALLDEEHVMPKKVTVQSVAVCPSGQEAYISFDRNPFDKESSVFERVMFIEGLLKTVRENDIKIQAIQFLVHHQPLNDYYLDFSNPWPVQGFVNV